MSLRPAFYSLIIVALLSSGCTLLQPQGNELSSKIDALVAEKKYGDALDMLSRVSPSSPDYMRFAEKRKQVETLAAQYERKTIDDARQMITQDRWTQALTLYDDALVRLPHSNQLRDGLAELHKQQQARLAVLEDELVIARGEWLARVIPVYRQMANIDPYNSSYQNLLKKHLAEAEQMADNLLKIGSQSQEAGNDDLAARAVLLAARLSERPAVRQFAQKFEQSRDKRARENRTQQDKRWRDLAQHEQERNDAIQSLTNDYNTAMKKKDYLTARTVLGRLRTFAPELVNERGYDKDLDDKITAESNRLYNEGVMYYGRSQFEKARDSWKKTLELNPTHTKARESLNRVEKVLERINQLRSKQKPN